MSRQLISLVVLLCCVLGEGCVSIRQQIVLDGRFDDWNTVPVAATDPLEDSEMGSPIDFGEVRINHDDQFVHLLIDLNNTINIQRLDGSILLVLDADGDSMTGSEEFSLPGVDIMVQLTPPNTRHPDRSGMGIGLQSMTYTPDPNDQTAQQLIPYDIGFTFAPTYASNRVELRLRRGDQLPQTPVLFMDKQFSGRLVCLDSNGRVLDQTEPFTHVLTPVDSLIPKQTRNPLQKKHSDDLRVVIWNAEFGRMLIDSARFGRVLAALKPDIICIQELNHDQTAEQLKAFLDREVPLESRDRWQVVFGSSGGNLRSAVASRFPLRICTELDHAELIQRPDRFVRSTGAYIQLPRSTILVGSLHLKCCGRIDSREDKTRLAEVASIQQAIRNAAKSMSFDGLILAGDMNLVGGIEPLKQLQNDLDSDGSDLAVVEPYQLDGRSNATWSDPKQPFVPGRLDYLLYSDARLMVVNCFVLDTEDLDERWLNEYQLSKKDTSQASDHLPVVVDFHTNRE